MRNIARWTSTLGLVAFGLASCSGTSPRATETALAGRIDENAPIRSVNSIVISAPAQHVWAVLADVDRWPAWRQKVSRSNLKGSLLPGNGFSWTVDGTDIHSRLAIVEPGSRISWTGNAMGLTAIHVWTFRPLGAGKVLVRTSESMRGFPSSLFYSSDDLHAANARWLGELKRAAEQADRPLPGK